MCRWCECIEVVKKAYDTHIFCPVIIDAIERWKGFIHSNQIKDLEEETSEISWDKEFLISTLRNLKKKADHQHLKETTIAEWQHEQIDQAVLAQRLNDFIAQDIAKEYIATVHPEEFKKDIEDLFAKETSTYELMKLKGQLHQNTPGIDEVD